jgi:hypothetical protein
MSASLSDLLTSAKNIVSAINGAAQTYLNISGASSKTVITTSTLVKTGAGRIASVSVIVGGAAGAIYDANATGATTGQIGVISTTIGVYVWNIPFSTGLVVTPGAGQTVSVSYS